MTSAATLAEFAASFPAAFAVFEQGRAKGLHFGAQVYVSQRSEVLADVGLGESTPGVPMTADHLTHWLSAGKPLTAVLIGQLVEQDRVTWNSRVVDVIPEFGNQGKERIALRHILTHTAGLRNVDLGGPELTWDETIARICSAPLDEGVIPGETAGYHVASTWFLLGEIVQRLTGRPFADLLQERICLPAGMKSTIAALNKNVSRSLGSDRDTVAPLWERSAGELKLLDWHLPPRCARIVPGNSLRGPIRELGRFYESLRRGGVGPNGRVLSESALETMIAQQRVGLYDETFGHIVDFGYGFLIDSKQYGVETVPYGYGRYCSPRTFGHGGAQSSQGYCDPENELVVACHFNGRPGEGQHHRRARAFNEAVYRDLGIAS